MPNLWALQTSVRIEEKPMFSLQCALEEGCLSSSAHTAQASQYGRGSSFGYGASAGLYGGNKLPNSVTNNCVVIIACKEFLQVKLPST